MQFDFRTTQGSKERLEADFRDDQGNLVDPETITWEIWDPASDPATDPPDSTFTKSALTRDGVGLYRLIFEFTAIGVYRWFVTGETVATNSKRVEGGIMRVRRPA